MLKEKGQPHSCVYSDIHAISQIPSLVEGDLLAPQTCYDVGINTLI